MATMDTTTNACSPDAIRFFFEAMDEATGILDSLYSTSGRKPEGEHEKAMNGALNNSRYEGISTREWANPALDLLTKETP